MKTYEINIKSTLNPHGSLWATLTATEIDRMGLLEFAYSDGVGADYANLLSSFETGFCEQFREKRSPSAFSPGLRIFVKMLMVDPKNENKCALAGVFAAKMMLQKMNAHSA